MKRLKKIILVLFCALAGAFILLLLIGIFATTPIEDRVLENVKIEHKFIDLAEHIWHDHQVMIVMEIDTVANSTYLYDNSPVVHYSADKTTVQNMLDAVVPKKDFIWRTDGDVIHIIAKSLDNQAVYPLNTEIKRFSETGNYYDLVVKVYEQMKQRNFPEKLIPFLLSGGAPDYIKELCPFKIKARYITLRQLLDRITLESKGKIHYYSVTRQWEKDGSIILLVYFREDVGGLSEIRDEPEPPCPKI